MQQNSVHQCFPAILEFIQIYNNSVAVLTCSSRSAPWWPVVVIRRLWRIRCIRLRRRWQSRLGDCPIVFQFKRDCTISCHGQTRSRPIWSATHLNGSTNFSDGCIIVYFLSLFLFAAVQLSHLGGLIHWFCCVSVRRINVLMLQHATLPYLKPSS